MANDNGQLPLSEEQLFALGAGAATGLGLLARALLALRHWRKNRPRKKSLDKFGGVKFTLKVRTGRRKFLELS